MCALLDALVLRYQIDRMSSVHLKIVNVYTVVVYYCTCLVYKIELQNCIAPFTSHRTNGTVTKACRQHGHGAFSSEGHCLLRVDMAGSLDKMVSTK